MNNITDLKKYREERDAGTEYDFSNEYVNERLNHLHAIIDLIGVNRLTVTEYLEWQGLMEMVTIKKPKNKEND